MVLSQRRLGALLGYANIVVKNLVNLVYTPMLLSFVGQADYGVYQTANSFVFSLTLLSFGFSGAYVRFYARAKAGEGDGAVRRLNGVYLALYAVASLLALLVGLSFSASAGLVFSGGFTEGQVSLARQLMAAMSANVAVTLFSTVFDAYIVANERFGFQQTRQLATTLATPLVALLLLSAGMGALGVALAQLSVSIVLLGLNARYAISHLGMCFSMRPLDGGLFRSVAAFSAWVFANQVCDLVNQNVPNVLLGAIEGAECVAVFAVAIQVRNVFVSLSSSVSNVFVPEVNRIVSRGGGDDELTGIMTRVGRFQMVVFCWVYGGFALLGRFFVERWAGPGFSDAYWLVLAMALPLSVPLCQNVGIEIQRAKDMHRARSVAMLLMAAFSVVFTCLFSPSLGYWAPAIAYAASIALGNGAFMNWYYHRRVGLDMGAFWRGVLPVALAGAAAAAPCLLAERFLPVGGWASFVAWGLLYTALFLALLCGVALDRGERAALAARLPFLRR